MENQKVKRELKEGEVVTCILVTGERAVGFYSCQNPATKSFLVEHVTTENGMKAEYAWAESIDEQFDNSLASSLK
jgi:hypothetical protein